MSINGRAKGKRAEREVARMLQAWWQAAEPGSLFTSTPASGGWSAPAMRGAFLVAGDICTTARRWPWTTEIKHRNGWSERELAAGRRSPVWSWWAQCCRAAAEERREPLLFFRRDRQLWRVMVRLEWVRFDGGQGMAREMPLLDWSYTLPVWPRPLVYAADSLLAVEPACLALAPQSALR